MLMESMPADAAGPEYAVLTLDPDGRIAACNPASAHMFGYDRAELIGSPLTKLLAEAGAGLAAAGDPVPAACPPPELSALRRDGSMFPVDLHFSHIDATAGNALVVMRDISREKMTREMMRKLTLAVEQTADSVMITDRNGVIDYVNHAFEKITGFCRAETIGRTGNLVKSGRHDAQFYGTLWKTIRSGNAFRAVFTNKRKDGKIYYEEKTITPIRDDSGLISHFVSTAKDVTERVSAEERLNRLANYDGLTGLPNRTLFLDRLQQALAGANRNGHLVALLFMDLNRFKVINDSLGHAAGDALLTEVAARLSRCTRATDTVARLGGDEFTFVISDVQRAEHVVRVLQKILDTFSSPVVVGDREIFVSTSIGVSLYPQDGEDADTLLKHADIAMYYAKSTGANSYRFYQPVMSDQSQERMALETGLPGIIERNELVLLYQPQMDAASGAIHGVEALPHWQHPQKGLIAPDLLGPLLEKAGMMAAVNEWILQRSCVEIGALTHQTGHRLKLAVNLPGKHFSLPGLIHMVKNATRETAFNMHDLVFEITESTLMGGDATHTLAALASLGVTIAIDGFGTGYSSLACLKRLPVRALKIDCSFVRDSVRGGNASAVAKAIISLAQTLGLEPMAEGVETEEQRCFLLREGCRVMQGHLFSKPLPSAALSSMIREQNRLPARLTVIPT